ncbi:MFS transporter [Streptomyces calidiresistens]
MPILCVIGVLVVGQLYTVLPLLDLFAEAWSTTTTTAGWVVTSFGIGYATGFLFSGPLADRLGRRRVLVTGLAITAVVTASVAAAPGPAVAFALRALQGLTAATFAPAAFAYLAEHLPPERRTTAMTWLTSSFLAAGVLGQVLAQFISDLTSWRVVFLVCAGAMAVGTLVLRGLLASDPPAPGVTTLDAYRAMGRLLTRPAVVFLLLAAATLLCGFVALYTGLQTTGPEALAGDADALLAMRACALPAMLLVPLLAARGFARIPPGRRVFGALLLAGLTSGLVALLSGNDIGVVMLGALLFVFVFAVAVAAPALVEAIGRLAGPARGAGVALYTFALFVGAGLGPQFATAPDGGYGTVAGGVAALLMCGAGMAWIGEKTTRAHR